MTEKSRNEWGWVSRYGAIWMDFLYRRTMGMVVFSEVPREVCKLRKFAPRPRGCYFTRYWELRSYIDLMKHAGFGRFEAGGMSWLDWAFWAIEVMGL
jgi:hypothetical protein